MTSHRPEIDTRSRIRVRVLGPVEIVGSGGPAPLVGVRQRSVAGLLALRAGAPVPTWRLIDALWGDDPPRTAVRSLHSHVARVRQALETCGLPDAVVTTEAGYAFMVDPGTVDAWQFEEHLRLGREELGRGSVEHAVEFLSAGLALWRHETALADGAPAGWAAAEVERLGEARLRATEDLWEARLRLGHHAPAPGELERLLVAHPFRERLVGLLMLALYRSGQQAAALDAYQRLAARLADRLGADPAPELVQLHARMLRREPELTLDGADEANGSGRAVPAPLLGAVAATAGHGAAEPLPGTTSMPRPAQLPAMVGHFTGRDAELAVLDRLLTPDGAGAGDEQQVHIVAISGAAGIGKTALAVQWAHRVADRFPDGQLFIDLRGHEAETALNPVDTLSYLLRSLGVPADRVPTDVAEQASLYRSLLHGRRLLVLADNGGTVDEVLPLVPAGSGNILVVTSRGALHSLTARHAVCLVRLEALTDAEARALLFKLLGAEKFGAETAAVAELSELCDRLPLALRIAAAKLAGRPQRTVRQLVSELTGPNRLDGLSVEGDTRSVRAVFTSAYRSLSPPAALVFRTVGLHPGETVHADLAAAMTRMSAGAARQALDELVRAHLMTQVTAERFGFHDLIRIFAQQCSTANEPPDRRGEAVERAVDWYLAVTHATSRLIDSGRDRVTPVIRFPPATIPFPADRHGALAFLDGERENLPLVVRYAAEHGPQSAAPQLTYLLTGFYDLRGYWPERIAMCGWAIRAARQETDRGAEGLMRSALGVACIMTRQFEQALEELHRALPLMRAVHDRRGEGHVYNNIAAAHSGLRRFDDAVHAFGQALAVHTANGHRLGVALALNNTGHTYVRMGRAAHGSSDLIRALDISREIGHRWLEAAVLHSLGEARLGQDDPAGALDYLGQAHDAYRQLGDRRYEAEMVNGLGLALLQQGRHDAARQQFRRALALTQELADQHLEAVIRCDLGRAHLAAGDVAGGRDELRAALALRRLTPDAYEEARVHRTLGDLELRCGDLDAAAHHRGVAIALLRKANATDEADSLAALLVQGRPGSGPAATPVEHRP